MRHHRPHRDQETFSFMHERKQRPALAAPTVVDRLLSAGANNLVHALTTGQMMTADRMDDRPYARFATQRGGALPRLLQLFASTYAPDAEHQQRALELVGRIDTLSGRDLVRELGQLGILEMRHHLAKGYAIPLHELKHLVERLQKEESPH